MGAISDIGTNILLFFLVFGMSATVDVNNLRKQLENKNAMTTGVFLQFAVLPFLGFAVVMALDMDEAMGMTLLVVTSSPGGSYSNWWCSMFNADLALSVTMTAISTLMSVIMLPVNLFIYTTFSYPGDVVGRLDWMSLFTSLVVVIGAIGSGLYCSARVQSTAFNRLANKLGNVAGVALVVFSAYISSSGGGDGDGDGDGDGGGGGGSAQLWERELKFYLGVASPCVLGLAVANLMSSYFHLLKPERVTVSVECCYQNTGIATSVAITMFTGDERARAIGVPLFYGIIEAVVLGLYCLFAWKIGWTKAPADESICVVIVNSYEVEQVERRDMEAVEVVLGAKNVGGGGGGSGLPMDLIFTCDEEGYTVDEGSLLNASVGVEVVGPSVGGGVRSLSVVESDGETSFVEEEERHVPKSDNDYTLENDDEEEECAPDSVARGVVSSSVDDNSTANSSNRQVTTSSSQMLIQDTRTPPVSNFSLDSQISSTTTSTSVSNANNSTSASPSIPQNSDDDDDDDADERLTQSFSGSTPNQIPPPGAFCKVNSMPDMPSHPQT